MRKVEKLSDSSSSQTTCDLLCIGTALIDCQIRGFDPEPVSATGYRAESASLHAGGEAVNVSTTAVKLGLQARILCALGEDAAGDLILQTLESNGVDTSAVCRIASRITPVTTMFIQPDGTRRSITTKLHTQPFHPEHFLMEHLPVRAATIGSLLRAPFDDVEIIRDTLTELHDAGTIIFADTKLPNFRRLTLEDLCDVLPLIDYIFPNEDEAKYCTGRTDPEEMADVFLRYGIKNAVIKLGSKGCLMKNDHGSIRLPACPVDALDATGAGDNFLAGFISRLLAGDDHVSALTFANACGAICCTMPGATGAIQSTSQVKEFLQTR